MEMVSNDEAVVVYLSERNLKSLLSKLEHEWSKRTIFKSETQDGRTLVVIAEPDEEHYNGRAPGPMHPQTEEDIKDALRS